LKERRRKSKRRNKRKKLKVLNLEVPLFKI
jgi:hypothetical protein